MHYTIGGESAGSVDFSNPLASDMMSEDNLDNLESAIEEDIRLCPLCNSEIRLFYVNFNEKILMCENTECEFPFGHEELQTVRSDSDVVTDEEDNTSPRARTNVSPAGTGSTESCNEINHINANSDVDDSPPEIIGQPLNRSNRQYAEEIRRHIHDIKELTEELIEEEDEERESHIKNEKWIRNLKNLQQLSGLKLLKPEELGLLKEEPEIGPNEVRIDIAPGSGSNISIIKVLVHRSAEDIKPQANASHPTGKDPSPV